MVPADAPEDPMLVVGTRLLASLAETGGRACRTALSAISRLDDGPLGLRAGRLASSLPAESGSDWSEEVGVARILRAHSCTSPGDGEALFLEAEPVGGRPHMLAAFIDDRLGGIAKHLQLIKKVDPSVEGPASLGSKVTEVDTVLACERVRKAIALVDLDPHPPVGHRFASHRALALARTRNVG
jgi:hypothetical protein